MVLSVRTALCGCLVAAGAASACTPDEDPSPHVVADAPIATDHGNFTITLRAAEGRTWPQFVGSTVVAALIETGSDPSPDDPQFSGDAPEPPFTLVLGTAGPRAANEPRPFTAKAWPITPDGFKWLVALDFKAAGDWELPVRVRDGLGRSDAAALVFHVEAEPE